MLSHPFKSQRIALIRLMPSVVCAGSSSSVISCLIRYQKVF